MATFTVRISEDGTLTPSNVSVNPGDTVVFQSERDSVLCVDPATVFGDERYEIPARQPISLTVKSRAPGTFDFAVQTGDLSAPCVGSRAKVREGTGQVGGGPD